MSQKLRTDRSKERAVQDRKPHAKSILRPINIWEDNIKMDVMEMCSEDTEFLGQSPLAERSDDVIISQGKEIS
jgi:hypothetical protein